MTAPDESGIIKIVLKNLQIGLLQLSKGAPMHDAKVFLKYAHFSTDFGTRMPP